MNASHKKAMNDSKQGKLKRYYAEIDELDEQEDVKSPYLARAIYLANEVDAVIAALEAENERLLKALQWYVNLDTMEKTMSESLSSGTQEDVQASYTQHYKNKQDCLKHARALLNREQEKP